MNTDSSNPVTLLILSDIHYAGAAERTRGSDYEFKAITNPFLRAFASVYRHIVWMRDPFCRTPQLHRFLAEAPLTDLVVVNGDYMCDSAFIGLRDPAAMASAVECIAKLKAKFGDRLHLTIGDHEVGKVVMFSGLGDSTIASWRAAVGPLGLKPFWQVSVGDYLLIGVASPLLALPANRADTLPEEWPEWQRLREAHLAEIRTAFAAIQPSERILLFCHDPTALPFLAEEETVRRCLPQIEATIIGHLHTNLVLWKSRLFSGIPPIRFLGHYVSKLTTALHESRAWRPFNVRLCPALAGIELLNDGGYFTVNLYPNTRRPAEFTFHPLPR